jgi:hypothetical protein
MRVPARLIPLTVALLCFAVALASCGGGGFVPLPGPYAGEFIVDSEVVGTFTFTTSDRSLAGTGMLRHDGNVISISIAGTINGTRITGTVANQLQGSGPLDGSFSKDTASGGTFSFTDTLGMATTTGTWTALLEE